MVTPHTREGYTAAETEPGRVKDEPAEMHDGNGKFLGVEGDLEIDEGNVEYNLKRCRELEEAFDNVTAHAEHEIAKIRLWMESEHKRIGAHLRWRHQGLKGLLWQSGEKTLSFVNGALRRRKRQVKVTVIDPEEFCRQWAESPYVRAKYEPAVSKIKEHLKATGEVIDGVEVEEQEDSFTVDVGFFEGSI